MRLPRFPIVRLALASALVLASSCADRPARLVTQYPPAEDVKDEAEPVAPPDILTSETAYEDYNEAVAAWGKRGWAQVGRVCRFFRAQGMPVDCPPAPALDARSP